MLLSITVMLTPFSIYRDVVPRCWEFDAQSLACDFPFEMVRMNCHRFLLNYASTSFKLCRIVSRIRSISLSYIAMMQALLFKYREWDNGSTGRSTFFFTEIFHYKMVKIDYGQFSLFWNFSYAGLVPVSFGAKRLHSILTILIPKIAMETEHRRRISKIFNGKPTRTKLIAIQFSTNRAHSISSQKVAIEGCSAPMNQQQISA